MYRNTGGFYSFDVKHGYKTDVTQYLVKNL